MVEELRLGHPTSSKPVELTTKEKPDASIAPPLAKVSKQVVEAPKVARMSEAPIDTSKKLGPLIKP